MIIDVHAHYHPEPYMRLMKQVESTAGLESLTIEERLDLLDETGVDSQILSIAKTQPYLPEAAQAASAARLCNDLYAEVCADYDGRFYAFGCLPLPHVDESLREVAYCLDDLHMLGITLGCAVAGPYLDDPLQIDHPSFEPIFAELDRRAATIFFHPQGYCFMHGAGPTYGLDWLIGAAIEDTVVAMRIVRSGMIDRFPNLKIVVPHLGGSISFLYERIMRNNPTIMEGCKKLWYDTVNKSPNALRCAVDAFGPGRLVYGTDYPYGSPEEFPRFLSYLNDVGLSESELVDIKGNTIARLTGLPENLPSVVGRR